MSISTMKSVIKLARRTHVSLVQRKSAPFPASSMLNLRTLSSTGKNRRRKGTEVPDEYFDPERETDAEFLEVATSLHNLQRLEGLAHVKNALTWEDIENSKLPTEAELKKMEEHLKEEEPDALHAMEKEKDAQLGQEVEGLTLGDQMFQKTLERSSPKLGLQEYYQKNDHSHFLRPHELNPAYRVDGNTTSVKEDFEKKFIPDSDPAKFAPDEQGLRSCDGGKQRNGTKGILRCHKIDLDAVSYLDVITLQRYLSEDGEILGKRITGLCRRCQRKVAKTVKHARSMGILPHLGHFEIQDVRPRLESGQDIHDSVHPEGKYIRADLMK